MEVIIEIKPAPGDHESNFKKVGSITWEPFAFVCAGRDFFVVEKQVLNVGIYNL